MRKREIIAGTVVPAELMKLSSGQALDRLYDRYYGTPWRAFCSHIRRWYVSPKEYLERMAGYLVRRFKLVPPTKIVYRDPVLIYRVDDCEKRRAELKKRQQKS